MKTIKLLTVLLFVPIFICCKKKDIEIVPIESLNYVKTVKDGTQEFTSKGTYYLVRGYDDSPEVAAYINQYVFKHKDKDFARYDNYGIIIYKESSETTIESIKRDPKIIYRYSNSHDRIYKYNWSRGVFEGRLKYKGETVVEPTNEIKLDTPKDSIK